MKVNVHENITSDQLSHVMALFDTTVYPSEWKILKQE
jgi:hypothetical protein